MAAAGADRAPFDPQDTAARLLGIGSQRLVEGQADAEALVQIFYDIASASTEALLHEFRSLLALTQLPVLEDSQITRTKIDVLVDMFAGMRSGSGGAPAPPGADAKAKIPTKDNNWFAAKYGEDADFRKRYPAADAERAKVKKAEPGTPDYFKKLGRAVFSSFTTAQKTELKSFRKEIEADQANPELATGADDAAAETAEEEEVPAAIPREKAPKTTEENGDGGDGDNGDSEEEGAPNVSVKAKKGGKKKGAEVAQDDSDEGEEGAPKVKKVTKKVTRGAKVPKKK